jgi:hypothetical protein
VFDATNEQAFWVDIKEYVETNPRLVKTHSTSIRIRIPVTSQLTPDTIGLFRSKSLDVVDQLKRTTESSDASRNKPR